MRLKQTLYREINAVVDSNRHIHLWTFLDQFLHAAHAELRRNRDHQTIPRRKNRQRAQRIFASERPLSVMSHRWDNRRIEPDQDELCPIHAATPGGTDADRERIRRS